MAQFSREKIRRKNRNTFSAGKIDAAGLLILATPLLLPRHAHPVQRERELARSHT